MLVTFTCKACADIMMFGYVRYRTDKALRSRASCHYEHFVRKASRVHDKQEKRHEYDLIL